jgi:pyruvate/2-oxoglutarate dehydrogenase complex dihydrolipoamide acyltransferase (E2) component
MPMTAEDPNPISQFVATGPTSPAGAAAQPQAADAAAAPQQATSRPLVSPRAQRLLRDLQGIRDQIQQIGANESLSAWDRSSALAAQRSLYRQKMGELRNASSTSVSLPPARQKMLDLRQEIDDLTTHAKMLAANPLLTDSERQSMIDRHQLAIQERAKQIQWLGQQSPDTDVDAPELSVP